MWVCIVDLFNLQCTINGLITPTHDIYDANYIYRILKVTETVLQSGTLVCPRTQTDKFCYESMSETSQAYMYMTFWLYNCDSGLVSESLMKLFMLKIQTSDSITDV